MIDQSQEHRLSNRLGVAFILAFVAFYLAQAVWILYGPPIPGWFSDSLDYLVLADFFSGKLSGTPSFIGFEAYGHSRFPPLFPLALAIGGGGTDHILRAYEISLLFGFLALVATIVWLRHQTPSLLIDSLLVPFSILTPRFFLFQLETQSESQFMLLLYTVLALATRYRARRHSFLVLGCIAALMPLSRMVGVALLTALSIWMPVIDNARSSRLRIAASILLIWVPTIAWHMYRRLFPIVLDYIGDVNSKGSSITELLGNVAVNTPMRLLHGLSMQFTFVDSRVIEVVIAVMLLVAIIAWLQRLLSKELDAFFLPLYIGIIMVWPYPQEDARLLAVVAPIVALYMWIGLSRLLVFANTIQTTSRSQLISSCIVLFVSVLVSMQTWRDILDRERDSLPSELASAKRSVIYFLAPRSQAHLSAEIATRFVSLLREVPVHVPTDECIWSPIVSMSNFYSGFRNEFRQVPAGIADATSARTRLRACKYIMVVYLDSRSASVGPLYPLDAIKTFSRPILVSTFEWRGASIVAAALARLEQ